MTKYLCGTAFQWELGETEVELYDSVEALKLDCQIFKCYENCGIVEIEYESDPVKYTGFKWVEEQKGWGCK